MERVRAFRVARHHLDRRVPPGRILGVVRDLVGLQGQVESAAMIALWARVERIAPPLIEERLERTRRLARTWCLRGTIHLIAAEDRPLLVAALGPEVGGLARALARKGLTQEIHTALRRAVLDALEAGPLSRAQLGAAVLAHTDHPGLPNLFGSWGGILRILSQEGWIVFGPRRGVETTFVRADAWWPPPAAGPDAGGARQDLLARYLHGYGPATLSDFAYWSGLSAAQARVAVAGLGKQVAEIVICGRRHYLMRRDLPALARAAATGRLESRARLLPSFDPLLLGHRDKSWLIDPAHYKKVFRQAGWVSQTILLDDSIAGTWTHERRGPELNVTLRPFRPLARRDRRALEAEACSLGEFLGVKATRVGTAPQAG